MNKKYLSALLFGALTLASTGTFTSCKDYDDDIENLQGQIDKLATKEDLSAQISTLESALAAAKSEAEAAKAAAAQALAKAEKAESTATEAEKAAAKAALDAAAAKEEAIKAAQEEVKKAKAELEATIDAKFEEEKGKLVAIVTELTEKVEKLTNMSTEMITSIDLQEGNGNDLNLELNYYKIADNFNGKKALEFGKGLDGSFTVKPGEIFATPSSMLVSVAPANAALPAEILSIMDSEGTSINDFVNLTSASYGEKLYQNSRSVKNGLYEITAELKKDADKKEFGKLIADNKQGNKAVFAVAATKEGRVVTSTYDLTITSATESLSKAEQVGRFSTIKSSVEAETSIERYFNPSATATPNDEKCYPVADSENFTIKVASIADFEEAKSSKILASYVTIDLENKALSTTDKAAIKGLTITGDVDKVSKENVFNIAIGGTNSKGVVVPVKVTYIDYTGYTKSEVVWVKAGGESAIEQTAAYVITPNTYVANPWKYNYVGVQKFTVPADAETYRFYLVEENEEGETEISIQNNKENVIGSTGALTFFKDLDKDGNAKTPAKKNADIAYAQLSAVVNLQNLVDDKVYTGNVKFYNAEGTFLSQSTITLQKVLPTAFPEGFAAKTNAINDGVLTVYPQPEAGAKTGEFALNKAFNGLDKLPNLVFSSNDANIIAGNNKPANAIFNNNNFTIEHINPALINDGKTYGAEVAYNYGDIRSAYKLANGKVSYNHSIPWATKFTVKFACMVVDSKYAWATEPVVYYNEDATIEGTEGEGKNMKYVNVITVKDAYNAVMNPFVDRENWNIWASPLNGSTKVTLKTTNEEGKVIDNEFFTAKFELTANKVWGLRLTKTSTEVQLKGDVKTDVIITIVDKFGHEHDVPALSFTMKKEHPAK